VGDDPVESISAVTLAIADMGRSLAFYEGLGFAVLYGSADAAFSSLRAGSGYVNLQLVPGLAPVDGSWGRAIFYVDDVDAMHARALAAGARPETAPSDAPWGERYFHLRDPDGHELSFARPLG
jgi:catechol 2,3-dioxygenase-like lactoylglutathione lyase family enzyme